MAGLRGYPQPGYKTAARDFRQSPPPSPKMAATAGNADVDAQLLQEIISGTAYSRKEQLLLEVIEVAAQNLEREAPIAAKALRVPARFMPWLNAFMIGYDVTNAALDAYEWWTSSQPNPANSSGTGAGSPSGYVAHQTGYLGSPWPPASPGAEIAFGYSNDTIGSIPPTFGTGSYAAEVYWYWSTEFVTSYFTRVLAGDRVGAGEDAPPLTIDATLGVPVAPPPPRIPFKLIPYINPTPPDPFIPPGGLGYLDTFFMTTDRGPPDIASKPPAENTIERKKQLSGRGVQALRIAKILIGKTTETCDGVEAIWNAIPESTRVNLGYQYEKIKYKRVGQAALPQVQVRSTITKGASIRENFGVGLYEPPKQAVKKPPLAKDALGRKIVESKSMSRISCARMAKAFALNPRLIDEIDWNKAINNLIVDAIQDRAIGFANRTANKSVVGNPAYKRQFGLGLGSAL